jgi:hypothetical protein
MTLEPIDPETALELCLADRETELSEATLYSHRSRLGHFVRWCDEQNRIAGRLDSLDRDAGSSNGRDTHGSSSMVFPARPLC